MTHWHFIFYLFLFRRLNRTRSRNQKSTFGDDFWHGFLFSSYKQCKACISFVFMAYKNHMILLKQIYFFHFMLSIIIVISSCVYYNSKLDYCDLHILMGISFYFIFILTITYTYTSTSFPPISLLQLPCPS